MALDGLCYRGLVFLGNSSCNIRLDVYCMAVIDGTLSCLHILVWFLLQTWVIMPRILNALCIIWVVRTPEPLLSEIVVNLLVWLTLVPTSMLWLNLMFPMAPFRKAGFRCWNVLRTELTMVIERLWCLRSWVSDEFICL